VRGLGRIVDIFRYTAKGVDAPLEKRNWVNGAMACMTGDQNMYMSTMVRREMRILQFDMVNIPASKLDEVKSALLGNDNPHLLDSVVQMYI
jgi:hypothetical protein